MKYTVPLFLLIFSVLTACQQRADQHLIADEAFRELVHQQFTNQKELAKGRDSVLFSVFDQNLTTAETEGLEFLYAFMPLSDLAMNDGEYNLAQVRTALEAKTAFEWGKEIPEDVFLHFVLPYRINNEYTDTARQVFFRELKDRISGMSMEQAALEVNHWCHEKVNYKSTDERTSGPLTTVRTAFGRCGEESTFTTAALRSVCIPARQVYTPRWAHTDDNHAWVEVWINGQWHFIGACEPEPALDMAWFAEPVKRAMMTHTFVYGQYQGSEEVLEKTQLFTRLNLLSNYTNTKNLPVKVLAADGKPAANVKVDYSLYNYAEFYPIATKYTDANGACAATTGFGDLIIVASKDGLFDQKIAAAASKDTLMLQLGRLKIPLQDEEFTLTPPAKQALKPVSQADVELNNRRLLAEDSIRNAYIASFIDSVEVVKLASGKGIEVPLLWGFLERSRGNWPQIVEFITGLSAADRETGMQLLAGISEKDLHDIQAATLNDHLNAFNSFPAKESYNDNSIINSYILSPRIGREYVTKWRSYIQQYFSATQTELFRDNPADIVGWISSNIVLDTIGNYYNVPLSPEGMLQLKRADKYSRNLLFVAICRSFLIPARLEPATRVPQFMWNGIWNDVYFGSRMIASGAKGEILLENKTVDKTFVPQYYSHYTIARFDKGRFVTLDYESDESLKHFPCRLMVDTGYYRVVTGNRQADGSVICRINYFRVNQEQTSKVAISLAAAKQQSGILGKADLQAGFFNLSMQKPSKLLDFFSPKGMIVALIDPGKEPTKHLMEDIKSVKQGLDQWGGALIFIVAKDKLSPGFNPLIYKGIPANSSFGSDGSAMVAASINPLCGIDGEAQLPVVVIINPKGEISWHSEGYSIGLGDQLLKQLKAAE